MQNEVLSVKVELMEKNIKSSQVKNLESIVKKVRGVRIFFQNVAGTIKKGSEFWKYIGNYEVICLTETWRVKWHMMYIAEWIPMAATRSQKKKKERVELVGQ